MTQAISLAGKIAATFLLLAFGAAMIGVGILGGIAPLREQAKNWTAAQGYIQVPAHVESAYLDTIHGSKGKVSYRAKAQFSYDYEGRRYTSDRISFSSMADNIGSFQHRAANELRQAMERGESIELWIDPHDPATAVYDRTVRPEMLLFHLTFGVLFPSVGLAAFYLLFHIVRGTRQEKSLAAAIREGRLPLVRTKGNHFGLMLFATLHVNFFAWLAALPAIGQFLSGRPAPPVPLILLPLAGVAMIFFTWRRWQRPRWTGVPVLEVTGIGPLRCRILFHPRSGLPSTSGQPIVPVAIDAAQLRERRVGKKLEYETVWQQRVLDRTFPRGTDMLEFEVDAPHLGDKRWRITLHMAARAVAFDLPNTI